MLETERAAPPPAGLVRARRACGWLPPLVAQRLRQRIYPRQAAYDDAYAFVERAQTGGLLAGSTADYHGYPFSVHGYFAWRHVAIALALAAPGDTIVEIGANVGTETVSFADVVGRGGRVFAIEPVPEHCRTLEHMARLNRFGQVEVLPLAVGDTVARRAFAIPLSPHASGTGHLLEPGHEADADALDVDCTTLDALARRLGRAHLVFTDAEGAELSILRGGRAFLGRHAPHLVLEAAPRHLERAGARLKDLYEELTAQGYAVYRIERLGLTPIASTAAARRRSSSKNWLCCRDGSRHAVDTATRWIRRIGLLPMVRGFNPLARSRPA